LYSLVAANVEVPGIAGLIAALGGGFHHNTPRGALTQGELLRAIIRHARTVPYDVEREQQPVLIIGECWIDLLYGIALARELRALIADLYRLAFLVFPFIRDRVGLR